MILDEFLARLWVRPPWYDNERVVITPLVRPAQMLITDMHEDWNPDRVKIITRPEQLRGRNLADVEVWWIEGFWSIDGINGFQPKIEMKNMAIARGAKGFWVVET